MNGAPPTLRVFGGIAVHDESGPCSIGGPRQRRLLALLAIRAGTTVSIDWIAEHLWGDEDRPEKPAPAVRTYLSRLRQALPAPVQDWIATEPSGYRMEAPREALEHQRFVDLRAEASVARDRGDAVDGHRLLTEALEMWRGEPFAELEDLEFARAEVERLRLDRTEMLEERWETALALGRHTQIVGELAVFTQEHRTRDRGTRQYALALYRSGRTAEALKTIADHRALLAEESGLDPSPAMITLEQAILIQDPTLEVEHSGHPLRGYRLLEEVGAGAFSVVWRGIQPSVGREVAIKQIRADLASQPEFIRRFEAEAHLIARIEHPHIVPLVDYWRDPDSAYLVMRYLRGGTLERRLDEGQLGIDETMALARQIGGALAAAHEQDIIHRDVKTGNIVFDEAGNAYLGDFGIALEASRTTGPEAALSSGSPAYAAPEQIKRLRLGPEADVFSLGVVLFECLAGTLPFADSASVEELLDRQLTAPYPPLVELRPDVPPQVSVAIATATAKDPAVRFPSVTDFLDALHAGASSPSPDASAEAPAPLDGANPYKGLRAFDDADTKDFFGRERLVSELVGQLGGDDVAGRCLVVVGPSGSGKSSVVRAGLVPALRSGALEGSDDWFVTTMVPGNDPYESLEAALLRVAVNPPTSLLGQLADGDRGILRTTRRCLGSDDDRVLLVIDQFEEIFTTGQVDRADAFLAALAAAVRDPASPLRLVATLRADYYHRPLAHPTFARVLKDTAVDVTPLAPDELERAIVEPARRYGVTFEPGLTAKIAAECAGQSAPLPLLQHALAELFERREGSVMTAEAYAQIGGLTGALAARAETLFLETDESEQRVLRGIFGRLTNPGEESADLRRRAALAELVEVPGASSLIERFGAARLLTFDRDGATRDPTVEVAHEALFREWPRLAGWLSDDAELLRSLDAVGAAADIWSDGGRESADLYRGGRLEGAVDLALRDPARLRTVDGDFIEASRAAADAARTDEQARLRRLRRLVAGVGVGLMMALIAGGVALVQQRRADDEARRAEAQAELAAANAADARDQAALANVATREAELAGLASLSAAQTAVDPELSLLLALELHRREPTRESELVVLNALGSSPLPNRLSSLGPPFDEEGGPCGSFVAEATGLEHTTLGENLITRDIRTGEVVVRGPEPLSPCVHWSGDEAANWKVAVAPDGLTWWSGPWEGPWDSTYVFETPWLPVTGDRAGRRVVVASGRPGPGSDGSVTVAVLDLESGELIGTPFAGGRDLVSSAQTEEAGLFAVSFGHPDRVGDTGSLVVFDGETGELRFELATSGPATAMTFDSATNELVANLSPRTLVTIDPMSGGVTQQLDVPGGARVLALSVRPSGEVMVVTLAGIEWFDRRSGPSRRPLELSGVRFAVILPDGTVYVLDPSSRTVGVVDVDGTALVERSIPIDPFSVASFNGGFAAVSSFNPTSSVELIDLRTEARTRTVLREPEGEPFLAIAVSPQPDGLWALNQDNVFARWIGDEQVDRFEVAGRPVRSRGRGDRVAHLSVLPSGSFQASFISYEPGSSGVVFQVDADARAVVHPARGGGLHVVSEDGTLRTYSERGTLVSTFSTPAVGPEAINVDVSTGMVAVTADLRVNARGGAVLIDPETGASQVLPGGAGIANLGFARGGELLAVTTTDGLTRLWDVSEGRSAGLVWRSAGGVNAVASWYDETSDSLWLGTSEKLVEIPLDPQGWIARACTLVGRDLTQDEWDRYIPGDEPIQSAC